MSAEWSLLNISPDECEWKKDQSVECTPETMETNCGLLRSTRFQSERGGNPTKSREFAAEPGPYWKAEHWTRFNIKVLNKVPEQCSIPDLVRDSVSELTDRKIAADELF